MPIHELYQDKTGSYWLRVGDRVALIAESPRYIYAVWTLQWVSKGKSSFEDRTHIENFHQWTARQEGNPKPVAIIGPPEDRPLQQRLFDQVNRLWQSGDTAAMLESRVEKEIGFDRGRLRRWLEGREEFTPLEWWNVKARLDERLGS